MRSPPSAATKVATFGLADLAQDQRQRLGAVGEARVS
jgi:hypothetical protein